MTPDQAVTFLECLRATNIRIKGNGWVIASCPLAQWTHKNHHDSAPSFGLTIKNGQRTGYHCFACRSGSIEELIGAIELYAKGQEGYNFKTARDIMNEEELLITPLTYDDEEKKGSQFVEWPQYWLQSFKPVDYVQAAMDYLKFRNVSATTIKTFDLRYDSKREMIVCPYHTVYGKFAGARGRSIHDDAEFRHFDYTWNGVNNAGRVWYGEQALNLGGPVVMVEGQFDVWRTIYAWQKTVGNLTAKPTEEKMSKLSDAGVLVHIPDPDEAGQQSKETVRRYCKQFGIKYYCVDLPQGEEKLDPDKCHPQYLNDRIMDALGWPHLFS